MKPYFEIDRDFAFEQIPKLLTQCPCCGKRNFVLSELIIDIKENEKQSFLKQLFDFEYTRTALPLLMVTCTTCGHIEFFNANVFKDLEERGEKLI